LNFRFFNFITWTVVVPEPGFNQLGHVCGHIIQEFSCSKSMPTRPGFWKSIQGVVRLQADSDT
jgi:hypothetical protein